MRLVPNTLTARLTTLLLVLLLSVAAAFGLTSYWAMNRVFERSALSSLAALATTKRISLDRLFDDYLKTARAGLLAPPLDSELLQLLAGDHRRPVPDRDTVRSSLRRRCDSITTLRQAEIADTQGNVVLSTDRAREGLSLANDPAFQRGLVEASIVDMPFERDSIHVRASAPVLDINGQVAAVLIVRYPADGILALTCDYTGLGETGEVVLGRRLGGQIEFMAPLRFAPDIHHLPRATASGNIARPMVHATAGQSGIIRALDYRGAHVVAAYRPIRGTGWGLVVKQDADEVFSSVRLLGKTIAIAIAILVLTSASFIAPAVRRFTKPIVDLAEAADRVAQGELDVTVPEGHGDEVGQLARSFNQMVRRLADTRTELSHTNEDLTEHAKALAQTNKEMETFAYTVSHDLRGPLVSICGMLQMLRGELGDKLSDDAKTYLMHINDSTQRMDQLIQDLLELSRVGKIDTAAEWIDTAATIEQVIAEIRATAGDRDIEFEVSPNLPKAYCNGKRFYQVVANLIGNAVKFSNGVSRTHIAIGCNQCPAENGHSEQVFHVRDNGPGIPLRDQERVFGLFHRLHGVETPGTGMGLALTERILSSLGGWIRVESTPGEGATFFFAVPARTG